MTKTRQQWKKGARRALEGNYANAIFGMLITAGANLLASGLTDYLFPGSTVLSRVLAECFLFIISLILSICSAGYAYLLLNFSREKPAGLGDLFYFFKNQPDRVIVAGFVLSLIQLVTSIPTIIYSYTAPEAVTMDDMITRMSHLLLFALLAMILQLLLTLPFTLTYYLFADDSELSGLDALKQSARMMKGHYGQYLLLQLSFVPLLILSPLLLYIPLLWLIPYMEMASVEFYRDLNGEFEMQYASE